MPQDCFMIAATAAELDRRLVDGRIDKVYMPTKDKIIISLRAKEGNIRLVLEAGSLGKVHITSQKPENPEVPPMLCMLLRKHLGSGRIVSVKQPYFERMMEITVLSADELGDLSEKYLIIEMMGRRNNLIFCDRTRRILGCMKRVDLEMSPERPILPGLLYEYPPKQDKVSLTDLTELTQVKALFEGVPTPREITDKVGGVSPFMARVLCDSPRKTDVFQELLQLKKAVEQEDYTPVMLLEEGKPLDFAAFDVAHRDEKRIYQDFSSLLDDFYREKADLEQKKTVSAHLLKFVENIVERQVRKIANQKNELLTAKNREELKIKADLITSNIHLIEKGMTKVKVVDYFSTDMAQVEIELDGLKTPQQNAQRLYNAYGRMKNAQAMLTEQIAKGESELIYLESILSAVQNITDTKDVLAVKEELILGGYMKNPEKNPKKQKQSKMAPRKYMSTDGFAILCGRNNIENDGLTMKLADKQDLWFHARNVPGSHVILVCQGKEPTDTAIAEAAGIAALFSKMTNYPLADIDYTKVKNVKKIPGAKPGMVTYTNFETAHVKPGVPHGKRE